MREKKAGSRSEQGYCLFDTELGACGVAWSAQGVTRLQLPEADRRRTEQRLRGTSAPLQPADPPPQIRRAIAGIQRYLAGKRVDFADVATDLSGASRFYRKVYEAARSVGWGQTASYGELARRAGSPSAARAVGQALARNPIAIIVPCHRILASGGKVGGFSAFVGTVAKEQLLALEKVRITPTRAALELPFSER